MVCYQVLLFVTCPSHPPSQVPCQQPTSFRPCSRLKAQSCRSRDWPWNSSGSTTITTTPSPRTNITGTFTGNYLSVCCKFLVFSPYSPVLGCTSSILKLLLSHPVLSTFLPSFTSCFSSQEPWMMYKRAQHILLYVGM